MLILCIEIDVMFMILLMACVIVAVFDHGWNNVVCSYYVFELLHASEVHA